MTTFIPSITLPYVVFANPAASVLLPITLGNAIGYSTNCNYHLLPVPPGMVLIGSCLAEGAQKTYLDIKQPPYKPPPKVFGPVWTVLYG